MKQNETLPAFKQENSSSNLFYYCSGCLQRKWSLVCPSPASCRAWGDWWADNSWWVVAEGWLASVLPSLSLSRRWTARDKSVGVDVLSEIDCDCYSSLYWSDYLDWFDQPELHSGPCINRFTFTWRAVVLILIVLNYYQVEVLMFFFLILIESIFLTFSVEYCYSICALMMT